MENSLRTLSFGLTVPCPEKSVALTDLNFPLAHQSRTAQAFHQPLTSVH